MAKVKEVAKELVGSKVGDNGVVETPETSYLEQLERYKSELKQIEAEYHRRIGKIELLEDLLKESK